MNWGTETSRGSSPVWADTIRPYQRRQASGCSCQDTGRQPFQPCPLALRKSSGLPRRRQLAFRVRSYLAFAPHLGFCSEPGPSTVFISESRVAMPLCDPPRAPQGFPSMDAPHLCSLTPWGVLCSTHLGFDKGRTKGKSSNGTSLTTPLDAAGACGRTGIRAE